MDTKPLERFATWARRELIIAVDAQATAILAVGSVARSERGEVVEKLKAAKAKAAPDAAKAKAKAKQ